MNELVQIQDPDWLDTVFPLAITSPIVGRFLMSANASSQLLVEPGVLCSPSTIVCVIESMHVYNEIPAGHHCLISEQLVQHKQVVEYGTPLFKISRPPRIVGGG